MSLSGSWLEEDCILHQGHSDSAYEFFTWLLHALPGNLRNNKHTCACVHPHTHTLYHPPPQTSWTWGLKTWVPHYSGMRSFFFLPQLLSFLPLQLARVDGTTAGAETGQNKMQSSPGKAISITEKGLICPTESPLRRWRETRDRSDPIGLSGCLKERLRWPLLRLRGGSV